ncbi:hypothetical protein UA08_02680 [Talaromyces atroroseus]|uniref:ER membrane protein complex subunit 10 n=1 Tax=Talaromyces atroroseus TaxID=1441469 RepID=A0A225ANH7_TALAT|nr:hypothetical protein UA08_02680 [Talaromyces atroroseus]OKL62440.1 hypothetical protein UA08_02680 [Talaromyces atroroseus]
MRDLLTSILFLLSLCVCYIQCQSTDSNALPKSADIYHWALDLPQPSLLAKIAYNPETLESKVLSYTPPSDSTRDGETENLYRIGFFTTAADGSKKWVGSLVSHSALGTLQKQKNDNNKNNKNVLQLYLSKSHQHDLYHVSLSKSSSAKSSESIGVELVYPDAGPLPELNKPVVLSPDGTNTEEVVEKTFFQKYWWAVLIVALLAISGGGGEGQ